MKPGQILFIFIFLLSFGNIVCAVPIFNDISVQDPEIWLGETETIFVNCTDGNSTISDVYADISTSTALFPGNYFMEDSEGIYYLPISTAQHSNFNKVGLFDVIVYCQNNLGESVNSSISFTVSNLSLEISSITSPIYVGDDVEIDDVEIDVFLKKDGNPITNNVSLNLFMGTDPVSTQPYYDRVDNGWVLGFSTDTFAAGTYTFSIVANYLGSEISVTEDVSISDPVDFSIVDVSNTMISHDDTITVSIKATDHGNPVSIDEDMISVRISSTDASISDVLQSSTSNVYNVIFTAPTLPFGEYNLKVYFNHEGHSSYDYESIIYVIPVSGEIFSETDNKYPVDIKFSSDDINKAVKTDNYGKYSTSFPPDTYDLEVKDDLSVLEIYNVDIDNFDDAIKYQPLPLSRVDGISGRGIFYYAIASDIDYNSARLKIKYDPTKINDVNSIEAYICKEWDAGNKRCLSEWDVIASDIDSLRKTATINSAVLNAAYTIGNIDSLITGATIEKETYNINENIKITGLCQDSAKDIVSGAVLDAFIEDTSITASSISDSKGLFSFSINNPKVEGNYTIIINTSKDPYIFSQKTINFEVVKRKEVSIMSPETIRMYPGESSEAEFLVINTGEADLSNLSISLNEIPPNYYQMIYPEMIDILKKSSEISVLIYFDIPHNASEEMFSSSFELSGPLYFKKQDFVINILAPKNDSAYMSSDLSTLSDPSNESTVFDKLLSIDMPTGNSISFIASGEVIPAVLFAILSFSTAFLFRRRKLANAYDADLRKSNRLLIFDIKRHILKLNTKKPDMVVDVSKTKIKKVRKNILFSNKTLTKFENAMISSNPSGKAINIGDMMADFSKVKLKSKVQSKADMKSKSKKSDKKVL